MRACCAYVATERAAVKPMNRKSRRARRKGVTTVEFAVVAPIVFFVLLALMQFAGLLMSKNVLTAAAREGGRLASMPSTVSTQTVESAVAGCLQRGGIDPNLCTIAINPTTLGNVTAGTELRISVSTPISDMGWIWAIAPPSANLSVELTYERE